MDTIYLTSDDLAEYLKVSRRQINAMRQERRLPAPIYVGSSPRWIRSEVDAYLAEHFRADS